MDKSDYQNKLCYLENRVVRELCKRRTACIINFQTIKPKTFENSQQLSKTRNVNQDSQKMPMQAFHDLGC